jgi:hypothetical protein
MQDARSNDDLVIPVLERSEEPATPVWRRFATSAVLILVGTAAHLWVVPSSRVDLDEVGSPQLAKSAAAEVRSISTEGNAQSEQPRETHAPSKVDPVGVSAAAGIGRTTSVKDSASIPDGTYPAPESPVGTSGRLTPAHLVERTSESTGKTGSSPIGIARRSVEDEGIDGGSESSANGNAPAAGSARAEFSQNAPPAPAEALGTLLDLPRRTEADTAAVPVATTPPKVVEMSVAPITTARHEEELVYMIVQEYRAAYERLDAAAAKSVWPTVDVRALGYAFGQLAEQRLNFESCGVSIRGNSASARCRGEAQYLPKVGNRRALVKAGEWVFDLARQDTSWHIVTARIQ